MPVKIKNLYIRLVGKTAHISTRTSRAVSRMVVDHHSEIDRILDVIYNVGEAVDIGPLKGVVGLTRLVLGTLKAMKDVSEEISQTTEMIITHLKCISYILCENPNIAHRLTSNSPVYILITTLLEKYQESLRETLAELQRLSRKHSIWHQTQNSTRLSALQQGLKETMVNFQAQSALITMINTCTPKSGAIIPAPTTASGVVTVRHISDITYQSEVKGRGFFASTYIADVANIGVCLVKRVPKTRGDAYYRFLDEMDEQRHPFLPQLRATLTLPKSGDLLLMFHSIDHEYMEMSFALGIGNDFWPISGGGFYNQMNTSWRSAEHFLQSSNLAITPLMAQNALVSGSGQMVFAFPEPIRKSSETRLYSPPSFSQSMTFEQPTEEFEDEMADATDPKVIQTSATVLQVTEVKGRIIYLSEQETFPDHDSIRGSHLTDLRIVELQHGPSYLGDEDLYPDPMLARSTGQDRPLIHRVLAYRPGIAPSIFFDPGSVSFSISPQGIDEDTMTQYLSQPALSEAVRSLFIECPTLGHGIRIRARALSNSHVHAPIRERFAPISVRRILTAIHEKLQTPLIPSELGAFDPPARQAIIAVARARCAHYPDIRREGLKYVDVIVAAGIGTRFAGLSASGYEGIDWVLHLR